MTEGQRRQAFTVTAVNGEYAAEVLYMNAENDPKALMDRVADLTQIIEALPAGAVVEVDILRADGSAVVEAQWLLAMVSNNAVGLQAQVTLAAVPGVRIRVKSGGTAGQAIVNAWWW